MKVYLFTLFIVAVNQATAKRFTVEVENFVAKNKRMTRSNASGNFSAHLLLHDEVKVKFCVRQTTKVSIDGIFYSNDGPSDTISVSLGEDKERSFRTQVYENGGQGWNYFRSSGRMSGNVMLKAGKHSLTIQVIGADSYGIELDKIYLSIGDESLEYADLMCNLYCFEHINYEDTKLFDSIPSGKFVQKSKSTTCAEQDNIRVDIYHDSATSFRISSHFPKYVSFSNFRDPDFDGCVLASPFWNFSNISISPFQSHVHTPTATLSFSGSKTLVTATVIFNFMRFTRTRELDERMIGSVLRLRLLNMPRENVSVKIEYRERGRWVRLQEKIFTPFKNDQIWEMADRTWDIIGNNQLKLTIKTGKLQEVVIDTLSLGRRSTADENFELYADSDIVFQGVRFGFWHHWVDQPGSMTVEVGDKVTTKVDSIRIYTRVPWTGGYAQVFVIFQDGRVRLQTMTPHGLDYIPFGSSVYIGQPKQLKQSDPYAPIRKISIDPPNVRLRIEYANGDTAKFELETTYMETVLTVSEASFSSSRKKFPIMTFKSMWNEDGMADVDHISVNGGTSRHIFRNNWKELYGISAVFFRKCISQHNTQAPDIKIQFV